MKLPALHSVRDYHEIDGIKAFLKSVGATGVKCKEVAYYDGEYILMAYAGKLSDKDNAALLKYAEKREKQYWGENED